MCYINILGVWAGGQAGGFDGVGYGGSLGILNHELGHAFSLPHWGTSGPGYPYRGDMCAVDRLTLNLTLTVTPNLDPYYAKLIYRHGIVAPDGEVHVGPTWAFDFASMTFLTPTCAVDDPTLSNCVARPLAAGETPPAFVYKRSPMWGGGTGDEPGQLTLTLIITLTQPRS